MATDIWSPHVTVAAVAERDGLFLLVEEDTADGVVLNQPAGHLEDDESLINAVIRETSEESAWRFEPQGLVGIYQWKVPESGLTYLRFCFWGTVDDHQPNQVLDSAINQTLWLSVEQLRAENRFRSPLVMKSIEDYLDGKHFDLRILNNLASYD